MSFRALTCLILVLGACDHDHKGDKRATERREMPVTPAKPPDSPAGAAIKAFYGASTCEEREKLIVFPEHNKDRLRTMPCSPVPVSVQDTHECDEQGAGVTCSVAMQVDGLHGRAWLVRQEGGAFLLDFRASELRQPTIYAIKAERPTQPVLLRVHAHLLVTDYDNRNDDEVEVELDEATRDLASNKLHATVTKGHRDAPTLRPLLADGRWHDVTVVVHYPPAETDRSHVILDAVIASSFSETEREHAFDTDGGLR
jgi:hypothetical protein